MSNNDNNRVLSRMGAHELTAEEVDRISGGFIPTRLTVVLTGPSSHPDERIDT